MATDKLHSIKNNKTTSKEKLALLARTIIISTVPIISIFILSKLAVLILTLVLQHLDISQVVIMFISQAFVFIGTIIFLIFILPKILPKYKTSREELGLEGLLTWKDIIISPLAFIASLIISAAVTAVASYLPFIDMFQAQDVGMEAVNIYIPWQSFLHFITLAVLAPITEEIIFRGWMYGKLRNYLSFFSSSVIVSVIFAVMHGQLNVAINVFCLSMVLCFLREITGTIWSGILVHGLKNGLAFFLLAYYNNI